MMTLTTILIWTVWKYPRFLISSLLGLEMKDTLEPLEADLGVSRFGNRIVPSGGGERGPGCFDTC